jgi:type II secretory ATPase GspE/PulE/Tfp pilus assembly ATPase PilB-like protein
MATFRRIQKISISRWEDPGEQPLCFDRPTVEEIHAYHRGAFARQQAEKGTNSPLSTHGFGLPSLFCIFDQVHFKRDSDLLLRHTSAGAAVFLRRDGTYYPVPGSDPDSHDRLVLDSEDYAALLNVITTDIVRKPRRPRLPFHGSAFLTFGGTDHHGNEHEERVSVRVSGLPSLGSWSVCFRFLATVEQLLSLEAVYVLERFQSAIRQKLLAQNHGLVLIAGPTGHGKTTAAYAILAELTTSATRDMRHVLTIEDPIECRMDEVTQIEVNQREGFDFAHAFHHALRHGPEVFFIGEIRSADAARAAVDAALSGHLTLATIHGGSTFDAISRLLGFGISTRELSAALAGVINHRLLPRLCPMPGCSSAINRADQSQLDQATWLQEACWELPETVDLRNHVWQECEYCGGTGNAGRVLLTSIVLNDEPLSDWLRDGAVRQKAPDFEAGSLGLPACAAAIATRGLITMDEGYRWGTLSQPEPTARIRVDE